MMRSLLLSLLVLVAVQASPQFVRLPLDSFVDLGSHDDLHFIGLESWGEQSSNTVYNELTLGLLRGDYLDRDLRIRSRDALKERNSYGYDLGLHMYWIGRDSLFGKSGWRPMIQVGWRDVLGTRFSKDVFNLAFFGNADYEDKVATLGGSAHMRMRYQTLGFGVASKDRMSHVRLELVNGQSLNASNLSVADVYTGVDGRVLDADLQGQYWSSDTAGSALGSSKGLGLGLSARWTKRTTSGPWPVEIGVGVHDLGFVMWDARSVFLERDTLINFEGLVVDDLFDLDGVLGSGEQLLDTFDLRYTTGPYRSLLPFRLELDMNFTLKKGWYTGFLLQQMNLPGYALQFTAFGAKRLGQRTLLGGELTAGGFGGVRLGFRARRRFGTSSWATLGCTHLPALFTGDTRGFGLNIGYVMAF